MGFTGNGGATNSEARRGGALSDILDKWGGARVQ